MRKINLWLAGLFILSVAAASAGDPAHMNTAPGSPEFQKMKGLAGSWEGTSASDKMPGKTVVNYRITGAGSALVEEIMPGTDHAMETVYYDENGKLAMTHYCAMGNRPHMSLQKADDKSVAMALDKNGGVDPKSMHMHSFKVTWVDANNVVEEWKLYNEGKDAGTTTFNLKRVQ